VRAAFRARAASAGAVSMPEMMEAAIIIGGPAPDGAARGAALT
jgi:hypothetical protein